MARVRIEIAEHWLACLKIGSIRAGCVTALGPFFADLRAQGCRFAGLRSGHRLEFDGEAMVRAGGRTARLPALEDTNSALIGYTSGSTGLAKGVLLTHANVRESAIHLSCSTALRAIRRMKLRAIARRRPAQKPVCHWCLEPVSQLDPRPHEHPALSPGDHLS